MLKKTKDVYKKIAERVSEAIAYNENIKDGFTPINTVYLEISRGLYNCGTEKILDETIKELGQEKNNAQFYMETHDNEDYCQLFIRFGEKPKRYGMEH